MTLKTLKPKMNISLILDDEFIQYCKLNNIDDVEKFAREVFNKGFTLVKYGSVPIVDIPIEAKIVKVSPRTIQVDVEIEESTPDVIIPKSIEKEVIKEVIKEVEKKDIYDE